jgi:hypothetical protein
VVRDIPQFSNQDLINLMAELGSEALERLIHIHRG